MYKKLLITEGGGIISSDQQAIQDKCATIAIGLGGTGISCLRTLKAEVLTRVKPDDPNAPLVQYKHIKYMAVDTDRYSLGDTGSIDTLDANTEFFNISCPDINGLLSQAHILAQNTSLDWLKTMDNQTDGSCISIFNEMYNTGGVRQIGRLLLIQNSKSFVSKLTDTISEALEDLPERVRVNIHIFTGLCGGTGAGIFLDVCYLIKHVIKQMNLRNVYTFGYFFLPDVNLPNININESVKDFFIHNGFAAMKELDYCMNYDNNGGEWNQQYDGFVVKTNEQPVSIAHLISAKDCEGNEIANPYRNTMHTVADYIITGYIVRPYADEDDLTEEPISSFRSLVSVLLGHSSVLDKKHGGAYNYCILGASNAYLPYKEITTYLTSKIFEGFANLPKQLPFDADIDLFVKNNRLSYADIYRELCDKMPAVSNITVDHKKLYEQVQGLSPNVIPQLLMPIRNVGLNIADQLQKNKKALLKYDSSEVNLTPTCRNYLTIAARIHYALIDIAKQADKGPYYASGMLHNLNARDLQKIVVGYKAENDSALRLALNTISLREESLEQALKDLQNSNFLNRKKKAEKYVHAVHAYYVQRYKIDTIKIMGELLSEFEEQLSVLYDRYYSVFASVMKNLQATFEANRVALSNPLNEDAEYAVKLITVQDLQSSLDATVAAMDIPGQIHGFISDMLNNPESWISQDENKIFTQVNKYFLSQLSEYTSRTIDDYLKIKFETTDPTRLQKKVYEEIISPLGNRAKPMFWIDNDTFSLSDAMTLSLLSIPNISDFIQAAARQYVVANHDVYVRTAWATDRITIFKFVCGVPLFGYKGVSNFKETYKQKKIVGSHLYEGSARDPRDSRRIINITPFSCIPKEMYTPDDIRNMELYDFALANSIVTKIPVGDRYEYHLNILDKEAINSSIDIMDKIINEKDTNKAIAFINTQQGEKFKIESYKVIPTNHNDEFRDRIVKDNVLGSVLYMDIMTEQVIAVKKYNDRLSALFELKN